MFRLLTGLCLALLAGPACAQPKAVETFPPDAGTLKQIEARTAELRAAVAGLPEKLPSDIRADVEVYLKAAEWIARHGEWLQTDSAKQTLTVLDAGLGRAKAAAAGKAPWRDVRGKPVVRGYRSAVDGSVQPYAVTFPTGFPGDDGRKWRSDIVLHGRDGTLTEVKFIATREAAKPGKAADDRVVLEPYGRGNNAYRWAGETDVFEAAMWLYRGSVIDLSVPVGWLDPDRLVLRGFSMGGAGSWHIGLHEPFAFAALQPGAGFVTTHGYVKTLPDRLPEYVERCLRIYDAVDYAENAFNVPVVAYSGEKDPQKAAADLIESALKRFGQPVRFTHVVAPGLEHRQPPEWFARCDAELAKYLPARPADRVRFVTYTTRYGSAGWATIRALDRHYDKAVFDGTWEKDGPRVTTTNIRTVSLSRDTVRLFGGSGKLRPAASITIDGQQLDWPADQKNGLRRDVELTKTDGRWQVVDGRVDAGVQKVTGCQGPIDDAFAGPFVVVPPTGEGWHPAVTRHAAASLARFGGEWDKFFRGRLPTKSVADVLRDFGAPRPGPEAPPAPDVILFGDPGSNPVIAQVVSKLPIKWTKDILVVNGVSYDPKTHVPVLIYPNPFHPSEYVVINSGHTFRAADLRGTNALLYPRLGDWAVLKVAPTTQDPAAAEVVAAGLFDEFWQFAKADAPKSFVAPGGKVEKLWGDGSFTEGPTPGPDGAIYFSDIGNRIMKFDPKTAKTTVFRDPSGRANGLKFDAQGRLVACEGANTGGNRRVSVTERDGTVKTLADKWMGKRFNSPNDLTIDAKGRAYFTDPRYVGDEPREIDAESVYRIEPDGAVTRVIADVTKPNGIAISPDGKTLYLAESNGDPNKPRQLLAYPLNEDGTVGAKKVLHDFGADRGIDGMTVTADGMIVATAGRGKTAGVYFFMPDGKLVGVVPMPEDPSNCCFAGPGSKTLYVTAGKSLYRVELTVAGK